MWIWCLQHRDRVGILSLMQMTQQAAVVVLSSRDQRLLSYCCTVNMCCPFCGPRWEVQPHLHVHSLVTREEGRDVRSYVTPAPHQSWTCSRSTGLSQRPKVVRLSSLPACSAKLSVSPCDVEVSLEDRCTLLTCHPLFLQRSGTEERWLHID